jgi:hypothetical protein
MCQWVEAEENSKDNQYASRQVTGSWDFPGRWAAKQTGQGFSRISVITLC